MSYALVPNPGGLHSTWEELGFILPDFGWVWVWSDIIKYTIYADLLVTTMKGRLRVAIGYDRATEFLATIREECIIIQGVVTGDKRAKLI